MHPVAPPILDVETARIYLIGDSTLFTKTGKKKVTTSHNRLKASLCYNIRGDGYWGKGLAEFNDALKVYLSDWSVEAIMKSDTVNSAVDPMGSFPGTPNWKVRVVGRVRQQGHGRQSR